MGIRQAKAPPLLFLRPVRQLARRAFALLAQEEGLDGIGEAARAAAEEAVGALGDVVAGGVGVVVVVLFAHCCVWCGGVVGGVDECVSGREEKGKVC